MGVISGEAYVTTLTPPTADFVANPDTMSIIYTSSQAVDKSTGNIISWMWDFGDNSTYSIQNPYHTYKDSIAIYQITLIVEDNQVDEVIGSIKSSAYSGKIGDGKIFVSNIEQVIRIRTGEKDSDAV
mgnify:CR=1 FL=1